MTQHTSRPVTPRWPRLTAGAARTGTATGRTGTATDPGVTAALSSCAHLKGLARDLCYAGASAR